MRARPTAVIAVLLLAGGVAAGQEAPDAGPAPAAAAPAPAAAAPDAAAPDAGPPAAAVAAADVAGLPRPGQASGVRVDAAEGAGWRWVPRVVLFVPRVAVEIAFAPVRGGAYLWDRFDLRQRLRDIFFNDTGTIGLYPVALFETGFGLNVGARFIVQNLSGNGERLRLRASYGGQFRQLYSLKIDTGRLLGRVRPVLEADYRILPDSRFYGIGNGDLVEPDPAMPPLDARAVDTAVATHFQQNVTELQLGLKTGLGDTFSFTVRGVLRVRNFDDASGLAAGESQLDDIYIPATVTGFGDGISNLYVEGILTYDSRQPSNRFVSMAAPSTGWHVDLFGGLAYGLAADDPTELQRYGIDASRNIDLYEGNRVLILRALVDAVNGPLDEVAFVDLPRLGGPSLLRGYATDRFRDRVAVLASAEYMFPIDENLSGYLFADSGRVFRRLADVAPEDLRLGYGGGLELHTYRSFLARVQAATSIDGGLFFLFSFDPVYDTRSRFDAL